MIDLYWSAGARDAHDGRTVFSRPGGGTRVGDRLTDVAVTLRSDPAAPFLQCSPFVIAHESGADSSVFDNGLPLEPTSWIDDGVLTALVQSRYSAELTGLPRDAVHRQPDHGRARRRPRPGRHGRRAPTGPCCSPACGTSGRSTRRPCC